MKLWTRVVALWPSAALYVLVSAATVSFVVTSALPMNHCSRSMIIAVHFILFPFGSIICWRLSIDFRRSPVMASRTAVAVDVAVCTARSRLVAVVIVVIVIVVVAVSVNLCEPRLDLPTVQRRG